MPLCLHTVGNDLNRYSLLAAGQGSDDGFDGRAVVVGKDKIHAVQCFVSGNPARERCANHSSDQLSDVCFVEGPTQGDFDFSAWAVPACSEGLFEEDNLYGWLVLDVFGRDIADSGWTLRVGPCPTSL